jgi:signal transduction histidine kinase
VGVKFYRNNDTFYTIQVSDTGVGIPLEMQKQIFEPFQQIHGLESINNNNERGFGLGLSIVKQLVDLLKGEIQVSSESGKGSIFTVKLPIQIPTEIRH